MGDPDASIAVVGLAPAAHGGNRTGRIFTGDRSGDFLFASLFRVGIASQPQSVARDDGMLLRGAWLTAINRCAPPANKPTPEERDQCLPYLEREVANLARLRVIVALGAYAWDGVLRSFASGHLVAHGRVTMPTPKPKFGHGAEADLGQIVLIGAFHPSQQNTFTGKLTEPMLDGVFLRAMDVGQLSPRVSPG